MLLEPSNVPVPVELAALLREVCDLLELEAFVKGERRGVGNGDTGVGSVHVLSRDRLEEGGIESRPDALPGRVRMAVRRDRYGRLVRTALAELSRVGVAQQPSPVDGDEQAVSAVQAELGEPCASRVHRDLIQIE